MGLCNYSPSAVCIKYSGKQVFQDKKTIESSLLAEIKYLCKSLKEVPPEQKTSIRVAFIKSAQGGALSSKHISYLYFCYQNLTSFFCSSVCATKLTYVHHQILSQLLKSECVHESIWLLQVCVCVCDFSSHHALVGVIGLVGGVQQLTVLQLLTQPLQGVEWLVELYRHGHLGQVLTDVVPQDVPQAHAAGGAGRGQRGAPTSEGHHAANWRAEMWREDS